MCWSSRRCLSGLILIYTARRLSPGVERRRTEVTRRPLSYRETIAVEDAVSFAAVPDTLPGILNFCPTRMLSVFRLLALRMALGVMPYWLPILVRLSPDLTV